MPRKVYRSKFRKDVEQYCKQIINGKIVAGRLVIAAVKRHIDDLKTGKKRGLEFDWRDDLATFFRVFPLDESRFAINGVAWICEDIPHRSLHEEPWRSPNRSTERRNRRAITTGACGV